MTRRKKHTPYSEVNLAPPIEVAVANGKTPALACGEAEVTDQSYFHWRKEYVGLQVVQARRLMELGSENLKLIRLVSELSLEKLIKTLADVRMTQGVPQALSAWATSSLGSGKAGLGAELGEGGDSDTSSFPGAPDNAPNRVTTDTVHGGSSDNPYIHDQWKLTKKLTENVELRYDLKLSPIFGSGTDLYTGEPNPSDSAIYLEGSTTNLLDQIGFALHTGWNVREQQRRTDSSSGNPAHGIMTPNSNHSIINNDDGDICAACSI